MVLGSLLKEKWAHDDPVVRLAAIGKSEGNIATEILVQIAQNDTELSVRLAAVEKIADVSVLNQLQSQIRDSETRRHVTEKVNRICYDRVLKSSSSDECSSALDMISDEKLLAEVATSADDHGVRMAAIERISSQKLLARITQNNCGKDVGIAAVERVVEPAILERIAAKASNKKVRSHADCKLAEINREVNKPTPNESREQELDQLFEIVMNLHDSWNWDFAMRTITDARNKWLELDPEKEHGLHPVFENACQKFLERYEEFEKHQETEQRRLVERKKNIDERESVCRQFESLLGSLGEEAALQVEDLESMWRRIEEQPGEEFDRLNERFEELRQRYLEARNVFLEEEKLKSELVLTLTDLCVRAEAFVVSDDWGVVAREFSSLRKKWAPFSQSGDTFELLEKRLASAEESFLVAKTGFLDEQKRLHSDGVTRLKALIKKIKDLENSSDILEAERQVKATQVLWKDPATASPVTGKELTGLTTRFQKACDQFFKRQRELKEQQSWEEWANLTVKEELFRAVEALEGETDIHEVSKRLKDAQKKWGKTGPVPKEKADEIGRQFKRICNKTFTRCRGFFDDLDRQRVKNLGLKEDICKEIETLAESTDWAESSERIKACQNRWSEIGQVPREQVKELQNRYRRGCDEYFNRRRRHFAALHAERQENLKEKVRLCEQAESLIDCDDWHLGIAKIKSFQSEWKTIGAAPKQNENQIYARFRAAGDLFFAKLDEKRPENLKQKEALIRDVESDLSGIETVADLSDNVIGEKTTKLIESQKSWKRIGPVARDREKEIWQRFHDPCNRFFDLRRQFLEQVKEKQESLLMHKEELLFKAESLADSSDWESVTDQINQLLDEWQGIAAVPGTKEKALKSKFHMACDRFFERKRFNFGEITEDRLIGLKKKEELCVRMELLADVKPPDKRMETNDTLSLSEQLKLAFESNFIVSSSSTSDSNGNWQNSLSEVKKIQKEWHEAAAVPRASERELSDRFKRAEDKFFSKRPKMRPDESIEEFSANLEAKKKICAKVEKYAQSDDPVQFIGQVKKCQNQWKKIGRVRSKQDADRLYSRYTKACDSVFDAFRAQNDEGK